MKKRFVWTEELIEEFKNLWQTESLYKLATHFHTITETLEQKALELGLEPYKSNRWTQEEVELLREYSKKYITKTIAKKLNRSILSVQKKAVKLGIELHGEVDPWKPWKIEFLKENINKIPIGEIEKMLEISYHRILTKCKELGIEYVKESWTEEEINILREYASKCHYTELVKVLPNRTIGAIGAKAFELGIPLISNYHKTNDETADYIKNNWGKIPAMEIARNLKVGVNVVYRYKKILNLPNIGQKKKWTREIINKLRKDAKTQNRNQLAKKYNTTPGQISSIARKNGIVLLDSKKFWTDELDKELLTLVEQNFTINEIADKMHLKASTVRQHLKDLDVKKYSRTTKINRKWTEEEVTKLKELSLDKTKEEIAEILNKTEKQITEKARKLNLRLKSNKNISWTEEENEKLISLSANYERHVIAQIMNRSEAVIKDKAEELGLNLKIRAKKRWTQEETNTLKEFAKEFTTKEIAYLLERSEPSVDSKLNSLNIKSLPSPRYWTEEECKQLEALAQNYDVDKIAEIMNKSYEAIMSKLYFLNIRVVNKSNFPWTSKEEDELIVLLSKYSTFEVAEKLNRSEEAIVNRAAKLGYKIIVKNKPWTEADEEILSDLWGNRTVEGIASALHRTPSAIQNRAHKMGLGSQIASNYDGMTVQEIADIFHTTRTTVLTSWVSLGLKLRTRKRSSHSEYHYVTLKDLYEFLKNNQNMWSTKDLEENIFGKEPDWLKEKRKREYDNSEIESNSLIKQQLIQSNKYYLNEEEKVKVKVKNNH